MSYFKIGSLIFLGGFMLFLLLQNKYYRASIAKKDKDISSLQLSLQAHEQIRKIELENAKKNKVLIQELQNERKVLQGQISIKQKEIKELINNDAQVKSWSEQKVPQGITEILDF